jgi:hypothetical protein
MPKSTTNTSAMSQLFVAGAAGGFVGAIFATPFDVLKSRAQNATTALPYSNSFTGILHLSKHEGTLPIFPPFFTHEHRSFSLTTFGIRSLSFVQRLHSDGTSVHSWGRNSAGCI